MSRDPETPVPFQSGELTVRIYTYPLRSRWYAEALDLALKAMGLTEGEAVERLVEQVVAYVRTAITRGWFDRLNRPVSLRHRLEVHARVRLSRLLRQDGRVRTELVRI